MGHQWGQTKHEGVRYREHPTRKHGVRPDQYFAIRYRVNGKRREEGLGWASQGWTAQKAALELAKLKEAHRTGQGAFTLSERREQALEQRQAEEEAKAQQEREGVTFGAVFLGTYLEHAQGNKKPNSIRTEKTLFETWIKPTIGSAPLKDVAPFHLEKIKKTMRTAGRSARSQEYALALVRQVFNFAKAHDIYSGPSPVQKVKAPKADNRRVRFLTHEEADALLDALKARSLDVWGTALLSLNTGLRAGEALALTWADVDFEHGVLTIKDTKSGRNRQVPMTSEVRSMLEERRGEAKPAELVFPAERGEQAAAISKTYVRTVADLGLNAGIEDARQKVVFHTLRHTCASWLVQNGVPLITVGRLLGHSTMAMTERYSHLAPDHFRQAVDTLEAVRRKKPGKVVSINGGPE
ncbi:Tyrosine recombinase XerD [Fundidesulfovibrio magnetotacticus]|uniref:Tyrosine recombinase XerD n=1 Tax=Fundidesulfovibrio magnetotacticus TaxID=2730080 RepID=A0A6V8LHX7_9BACT|nr:site-specific integrase [Fundidesulfovibrio magnetotacticus]GFK92332.1 Tyrosine recombinase XerD [Fundidesulfovibrio magnetotacticus]